MCCFHSIVSPCRAQYPERMIYHTPENSHSGTISHYNLRDNEVGRYNVSEFEGDGQDPHPKIDDLISNGVPVTELSDDVVRAVVRHYDLLHVAITTFDLIGPGEYFGGEEYSDVRRCVAENPSTPPARLDALGQDADADVRRIVLEKKRMRRKKGEPSL